MRLALAACLLTGCLIEPPQQTDPPPDTDSGWGSGWGGGGGSTGYGCYSDSACPADYVCARNGECTPATSVRIIHVMWTLKGEVASTTSCASSPQLAVTFYDASSDLFGFAPVPCDAGKYTIDKMPVRFTKVALGRANSSYDDAVGMFDETGNATLDLPY